VDPRDALLMAIRENMEDNLPRLAYADWLEEHGEPELAEFIRVECRLSTMPDSHPERRALFSRDLELLGQFSATWIGPARHGFSFWEVRRGFLDEITTSADHYLQHAEAIFRRHPLRVVRLDVQPEDLAPLAACPYLLGVRELTLTGTGMRGDVARAVARSKALGWLDSLRLDELGVGPAGARALAKAPALGRLRVLRLRGAAIGPDGAEALVASPRLPRLEALDLSGRGMGSEVMANVGDAGLIRLAGCPGAGKLRVLVLEQNALTDAGARALAESPYLEGLRVLYLGFTDQQMTGAGRKALEARFGSVIRRSWGW
jgi:uncharacterized protein (TIGR02996 family)